MSKNKSYITSTHEQAILQQTPNGVLLVDNETKIKFVNPSFKTMFKCTDEEMENEPAIKYVHSDCFERAIAAGGRLMVNGCEFVDQGKPGIVLEDGLTAAAITGNLLRGAEAIRDTSGADVQIGLNTVQ